MTKLLTGGEVAAAIGLRTAQKVKELEAAGLVPTLAVVRVGAREDDLAYERGAIKRCNSVGIAVKSFELPETINQSQMLETLTKLNTDPFIHGVLLMRPLPAPLNEFACFDQLDPAKDVDGATRLSLAKLLGGVGDGFSPCTAQAVVEMLDYYHIELRGKRVCVVGRSLVIGKPVALLLLDRHATVTICHSKTSDLAAQTRQADIVVVASGQTESLGAEYFSEGQTVIDVGIGWSEARQKLCGDVIFDEVEPIVAALTPVPGGVGSLTTAVLADHVADAAASRHLAE